MSLKTMNHFENPVTTYANHLTEELQNIKAECFLGNGNKAKKEHLYKQRLRDFFQDKITEFKNVGTEKTTTGQISSANVKAVVKEENASVFLNRLDVLINKVQTELGNNNFGNNIEKEIETILNEFMNWCKELNNRSQSTSKRVTEILES